MVSTATNLTIRIDRDLKERADELFNSLGMTLSTAFNIFVRQSLRAQGLPFAVTRDVPNAETAAAMREAERLARDPRAKRLSSMDEILKELDT